MSPLATTYTGESWATIRARLATAAAAINGHVQVAGVQYPRISNASALAIAQALRKMRRAWKISAGTFWPDLWYHLLGYYETGDRFIMTTAHAAAEADPELIAALWEYAEDSALELDRRKASPLLLVLDLTYKAYEAAAADAWSQLKADRKVPVPVPVLPGRPRPPDAELPPPVPAPPLPLLPKPSLGGAGAMLALLLIAYVAGKDRRR